MLAWLKSGSDKKSASARTRGECIRKLQKLRDDARAEQLFAREQGYSSASRAAPGSDSPLQAAG